MAASQPRRREQRVPDGRTGPESQQKLYRRHHRLGSGADGGRFLIAHRENLERVSIDVGTIEAVRKIDSAVAYRVGRRVARMLHAVMHHESLLLFFRQCSSV
eukprot:scaffold7116_cov296-Pinguiococcus_pyrenoidosus.AAC.11